MIDAQSSDRIRSELARSVSAAALCALLVVISVALIDRPVATWVHEHLGLSRFAWVMTAYDHPLVIEPFSLMIGPADLLSLLAPVGLAIVVLAAAAGGRVESRGRIALGLSLAPLLAAEISQAAQLVFGRTWPESWQGNNPSWIRDGVFGFFPFHRGAGWGSFPSGHTAITLAPATLLWIVWPELRLLWVMVVVIDMAGLIGANYHFMSDIIAGACLGVVIGRGMAALIRASWHQDAISDYLANRDAPKHASKAAGPG